MATEHKWEAPAAVQTYLTTELNGLADAGNKLGSKMVRLDGMLMIGSAGANVGKTELACAILRKFSKKSKISVNFIFNIFCVRNSGNT